MDVTEALEQFPDKERIRLVEADLAQTNEFIKSVVGTGTAVRGIGVTIWLALIGVAVQQASPWLAVVGVIVAGLFWMIDGFYGWLYTEASVHARASERVLSDYFNAISRGADDPEAMTDLHVRLRSHHVGLYQSFRSDFGPSQWWAARPRLLYRSLYPALIGTAVVVAVLGWSGVFDHGEGDHRRDRSEHHREAPQHPGPPPARR